MLPLIHFELRWLRQHGKPDVLQYRELNEYDPNGAIAKWRTVNIAGPHLTKKKDDDLT